MRQSKRKMAAKFASTIHSQISQSEAFLSLGLFDKTTLQIVPKNFTSVFKCSYKCSFCLIVNLTVISKI